ncbi:hypothetical protein Hanom_Chr00s105450g01805641 [Helianthus anomalus]
MIMAYKLFMFTLRIQTPIGFTYFVFSSSESSISLFFSCLTAAPTISNLFQVFCLTNSRRWWREDGMKETEKLSAGYWNNRIGERVVYQLKSDLKP